MRNVSRQVELLTASCCLTSTVPDQVSRGVREPDVESATPETDTGKEGTGEQPLA